MNFIQKKNFCKKYILDLEQYNELNKMGTIVKGKIINGRYIYSG